MVRNVREKIGAIYAIGREKSNGALTFWAIFATLSTGPFHKRALLVTMTECEFCRILSGDSAAEVLYRSEHAIAILDINPIHFGHVLVIPRTHAQTFLEVPEAELPSLILATKIVSRAIVDALKPPGFNIFSNNGRAAGQSVFHFHFHVTPRYDDDNIRFVLKLKKYGTEEMGEYGEKLRRQINANLINETQA